MKLNYEKPRFWKVIFTFMIAIFHFNNIYPVLYQKLQIIQGWYIGVEFFFLTSGILLAHKSCVQREKGQHISAIKYTMERLKKLYPEYLAALVITVVILVCIKTGTERKKILLLALGEAFMLQQSSLYGSSFINNITWYVAAMLIAGTILYYLYDNWKRKTVRVILFILSLGIYGYFYFTYRHLDVWMGNVKYIGMKVGVLRALAGMSAGILIYESGKWIQKLTKDKRIGRVLYSLECMGYVFVVIYSFGLYFEGGYTKTDFLFLLILMLCVTSTFFNTYGNDRELFNNCITEWLGKLTYGIYLNHNLWRGRIFPRFFSVDGYSLWWLLLYLIIVVLYTYVVNKLVWWIVDKSCLKKMRIL